MQIKKSLLFISLITLKSPNDLFPGAELRQEAGPERDQMANPLAQQQQKYINVLNAKLGNSLTTITLATERSMGLNFTTMLNIMNVGQ